MVDGRRSWHRRSLSSCSRRWRIAPVAASAASTGKRFGVRRLDAALVLSFVGATSSKERKRRRAAALQSAEEIGTLSSNAVERPLIATPPEAPRPVPAAPRSWGLRLVIAVLAPAVAAGVALSIHQFLPNGQILPMSWMDKLPAWQHPYPLLLDGLLALSLLAAVVQWAWRPLRPWVRHYAPLLAGALVLLCLLDLMTVKLAWLRLPFFPGPDDVLGAL